MIVGNQLSSGITSILVMSKARMLVEWAVPWLFFYLGLSVATAVEYTSYHHFEFVSKTEVQANFSILKVPPRSDSRFCSTWGNYHFKTFDDGFLQLPSNCTYTFVRQCKGSFKDFNIAIQRQETRGIPFVTASMKLDGLSVELSQSSIRVDTQK